MGRPRKNLSINGQAGVTETVTPLIGDEDAIGDPKPKPLGRLIELPLEQIEANPENARTAFDHSELMKLMDSIVERGVVTPITVNETTDHVMTADRKPVPLYRLVSGHRRVEASRRAQRLTIPAIVVPEKSAYDTELDALVENSHREDLSILDLAKKIRHITTHYNVTVAEVAVKMGHTPAWASNIMRVLDLPDRVQLMIAPEGNLSGSAAIHLATLKDYPELCHETALLSVREEWPTSKMQTEVKRIKGDEEAKHQSTMDMGQTTIDDNEYQNRFAAFEEEQAQWEYEHPDGAEASEGDTIDGSVPTVPPPPGHSLPAPIAAYVKPVTPQIPPVLPMTAYVKTVVDDAEVAATKRYEDANAYVQGLDKLPPGLQQMHEAALADRAAGLGECGFDAEDGDEPFSPELQGMIEKAKEGTLAPLYPVQPPRLAKLQLLGNACLMYAADVLDWIKANPAVAAFTPGEKEAMRAAGLPFWERPTTPEELLVGMALGRRDNLRKEFRRGANDAMKAAGGELE